MTQMATLRSTYPAELTLTLNAGAWPGGTITAYGERRLLADITAGAPPMLNSISMDSDWMFTGGQVDRQEVATGWFARIEIEQATGADYPLHRIPAGTLRIKVIIENTFDRKDHRYQSFGYQKDVVIDFTDVLMNAGIVTDLSATVPSTGPPGWYSVASITGPRCQPAVTLVDVTSPAIIQIALTEFGFAAVTPATIEGTSTTHSPRWGKQIPQNNWFAAEFLSPPEW